VEDLAANPSGDALAVFDGASKAVHVLLYLGRCPACRRCSRSILTVVITAYSTVRIIFPAGSVQVPELQVVRFAPAGIVESFACRSSSSSCYAC
jgi:hypothetical protein